MIVLRSGDIQKALSMEETITAMKRAFAVLSDMQEVPAETVARALVVVDSYEAALAEAGDLIQPIQRGLIRKEDIHAELGEIVLERKHGRTHPSQITFFKSVGVAVQDAAAARIALLNAHALGLGQQVKW